MLTTNNIICLHLAPRHHNYCQRGYELPDGHIGIATGATSSSRRDRHDADELERAIARRRWVHESHLYAKHVASNSFTRYRPCPSLWHLQI
ncbi:uncharacterized protein F5147DRAFT_41013 [Suillus discolor]|uniref:Uncharacterized protein n=1 Tax=Suillus discolor TaxID=1912936 RepID=A0A9P7JM43_9AGAM|nr:uncharacterized protein F5147DRAFT_41013 [Suillus discolor]KAG2089329.1 hypothetical protein F5147DRAFT_41013 [Suillus discolor]